MPITLTLNEDTKIHREAAGRVFSWFKEVDRIFSTYKPKSEISLINRGELELNAASSVARRIMQRGKLYKEQTDGYFDMTTAAGLLDPSGLVKGWSIAEASRLLRADEIDDFCIEAGGDVQTAGTIESGQPWLIGIRDPDKPTNIVKTIALSGEACATSGLYERGNHIYNPFTGLPAVELTSVTVVGPNIEVADVYATAIFAAGKAGMLLLAKLPEYAAYAIDLNREAIFSANFQAYIAKV